MIARDRAFRSLSKKLCLEYNKENSFHTNILTSFKNLCYNKTKHKKICSCHARIECGFLSGKKGAQNGKWLIYFDISNNKENRIDC